MLLLVLLALSIGLAGCAQPDEGGSGDEEAGDGGADGDQAVREFTVEGSEWQLDPANVTVPAGEEITVTFENVGSNQHNWGVDLDGDGETSDDVKTATIQEGERDEVTFTIDEPGEYAVYCAVTGHRDAGMEGTLTVE